MILCSFNCQVGHRVHEPKDQQLARAVQNWMQRSRARHAVTGEEAGPFNYGVFLYRTVVRYSAVRCSYAVLRGGRRYAVQAP
ncbi:hypothetical protein GBAR_LOCUS19955 [Geodia barretti]|uniref:Uncharacterized protein n=1 Tax=Geodia barretti TaxID=519541 RepID=A0AA35SUJ0_GEOBA|nr:hypothetical protein GBAR_LOCUS19955 [Geodia barretti]